MRRQRLSACLLALLIAAAAVAAEDGFSLFSRFREDGRLARMQFAQQNFDEQGEASGEESGVIWYRPPNLFRLEYDSPGKPLVVSDGGNIHIYEKDLRQVVVRRFQPEGEHGLLSVLTGGLDALRRRYVFTSNAGGDLVWLSGETLSADDPIPRVRLGFSDGGELRRMEMHDAFGGRLSLDITDFARGGEDGELFSFVPPPNTVVIRSDD